MSVRRTIKARAKRRRSIRGFTTLDDVLAKDGTLEEFQAVAIKEVLAWQLNKVAEAVQERVRMKNPRNCPDTMTSVESRRPMTRGDRLVSFKIGKRKLSYMQPGW